MKKIYDYLDNIGYLDKRTEYKNAAIYLKISIPSSFYFIIINCALLKIET